MKIKSTSMDNLYIIEEDYHHDNRGYFMESWNELSYSSKGLINELPAKWALKDDGTLSTTYFVQDNISVSHKGVFRGLHYQTGINGQAKLVRVLKGSAIDFVVDLREMSDTYGKFEYFDLNDRNKLSLFVPPYFAHGFLSLEDETIFTYKCGNYYDKTSEGSVNIMDPIIRHVNDGTTTIKDIIDMYYPCDSEEDLLLSYKDRHSPKFLKRKY
jgi:dTDP-4-dehydrorhamnose 3,5-epimerase|tara:strand:- start:221 stop:859 length:639 start_codon:yes stop_codon:yes gene_type:complete